MTNTSVRLLLLAAWRNSTASGMRIAADEIGRGTPFERNSGKPAVQTARTVAGNVPLSIKATVLKRLTGERQPSPVAAAMRAAALSVRAARRVG